MIDQNSQFFAMLTAVGEAKHANAIAMGLDWMFTDMGVGDANDTNPIPDRLQTQLINEWRRAPINQIRVSPTDARVVITEQVIPADVGGKWIREIGLYDIDGDLVALANCAPSFKPLLSQGTGKTQVVRMNFIVSSSANITLRIDPAVVLATREYVDTAIIEALAKLDHKDSVAYTTTADVVLSGLGVQSGGDWIAALSAGARVLVKDQAAANSNGIYSAAAGAWARTGDADSPGDVTSGLIVAVEQGQTLADTRWQLLTDGVVVLGTTALHFQNVTFGFAPLSSPVFTDAPKAPTPAQFDSSTLLSTTDFVRRALGNRSQCGVIGASRAITLADLGGEFVLAAPGSISLEMPSLASVVPGASIRLVNLGSAPCTFSAVGADCFMGPFDTSGFAASFTLYKNDEVSLTAYHGTHWVVVGSGSVSGFGVGYGIRELGGGLMLQWGTVTGPVTPANDRWELDITFPLAFPSGCYGVVGSPGIAATDLDGVDDYGVSYRGCRSESFTGIPNAGGFEAVVHYTNSPADSRIYTWHAIGH
jgi:hypothetical protein